MTPPTNYPVTIESIELEAEKEKKQEDAFAVMSLADLYRKLFPPQKWLVDRLVPYGGIVVLTGVPASCKSWLAQEMAAAVADGRPFLGRFDTIQNNVLILDEENNPDVLQERFGLLGTPENLSLYIISQSGVKFDQEDHLKIIQKKIRDCGAKLVIIDSLVRIHGGEENESGSMSRLFEKLRLITKEGIAVLLIHHHRKTLTPRKVDGNDIRGSGDILAAVDAHIAVSRKDDQLVIHQTKLRRGVEMKPFDVAIETEGGSAFKLTYVGPHNDEEGETEEIKESIIGVLSDSSEPAVIKELAERVDYPSNKVRKAIKSLLKAGTVEESTGRHNTKLYTLVKNGAL